LNAHCCPIKISFLASKRMSITFATPLTTTTTITTGQTKTIKEEKYRKSQL